MVSGHCHNDFPLLKIKDEKKTFPLVKINELKIENEENVNTFAFERKSGS